MPKKCCGEWQSNCRARWEFSCHVRKKSPAHKYAKKVVLRFLSEQLYSLSCVKDIYAAPKLCSTGRGSFVAVRGQEKEILSDGWTSCFHYSKPLQILPGAELLRKIQGNFLKWLLYSRAIPDKLVVDKNNSLLRMQLPVYSGLIRRTKFLSLRLTA